MDREQPDGYLAVPTAGSDGAVLVLHAWWGLNETMKAFCRRLSEAGFTAFAPDLYHGKVTDTIPEAEAFSDALDPDQAYADIVAATKFLSKRYDPAGEGLAVIGFSLGAYFALDLSARDPEHIRSVVVFYGTGPEDFKASKARYLGHFAEADPFEPREAVERLEEVLREAGRPLDFHLYPGTGHWFFEPDREEAFNPKVAQLAWERTLEFLRG